VPNNFVQNNICKDNYCKTFRRGGILILWLLR